MLPLLLRQLKGVNWWRKATIASGAVIVVLLINLRSKGLDVQQARLAYENPRVQERKETKRVEGPVQIVTKTLRTADGEEVTVWETRGEVVTTVAHSVDSEPVFAPVRLDRWLLGGGPSWRPGETVEYSVMAGRSWANRIDLSGEISQRGRIGGKIVFRF